MAVLGITLLSCSLTAVVYLLYRRFSRISLAHIRGPPVGSFLLGEHQCSHLMSITYSRLNAGNLPELFQSEAGTVINRLKSMVFRLLVTDSVIR